MTPRSRSSAVSVSNLFRAPRSLNAPVRCWLSSLRKIELPVKPGECFRMRAGRDPDILANPSERRLNVSQFDHAKVHHEGSHEDESSYMGAAYD